MASLSKASQTRCSFPSSLFEEYNYNNTSQTPRFAINLVTLLDCLNIFGTGTGSSDSPSLSLSYDAEEMILRLCLEEENGVLTTCELPSLYEEEEEEKDNALGGGGLFLAFKNAPELFSVIIKSELLRESIQELLEVSAASHVRLEVLGCSNNSSGSGSSGRHQSIRFSTEGSLTSSSLGMKKRPLTGNYSNYFRILLYRAAQQRRTFHRIHLSECRRLLFIPANITRARASGSSHIPRDLLTIKSRGHSVYAAPNSCHKFRLYSHCRPR